MAVNVKGQNFKILHKLMQKSIDQFEGFLLLVFGFGTSTVMMLGSFALYFKKKYL